ncbi:Magnetosome protein MmsF [Azospirillaceae bacterium]
MSSMYDDQSDAAMIRPRLMAALSYLGILCFVPVLFGREDPFVQFHARQGIVIWAWSVLALMSLSLPGLGWFFHFSSSFIVIMSAIGLLSVFLRQTWQFPLIHDLAKKL